MHGARQHDVVAAAVERVTGLHFHTAAAARVGWGMPRPRAKFGHGVQTVFTVPGGGTAGRDGQRAGEREVRVVGCYHVSQQNTFTGRLTESMLDDVIAQL